MTAPNGKRCQGCPFGQSKIPLSPKGRESPFGETYGGVSSPSILEFGSDTLTEQKEGELERLFTLPFTIGSDQAEGLTLFSYLEEPEALMVVYDSPTPNRRPDVRSLYADVFSMRQIRDQ